MCPRASPQRRRDEHSRRHSPCPHERRRLGDGPRVPLVPTPALRDSVYLFAGWWIHLLIAEGLTNRGIAKRLVVTEGAVEKHVQRIFTKLDLHTDGDEHRRVAAVLTFLRSS